MNNRACENPGRVQATMRKDAPYPMAVPAFPTDAWRELEEVHAVGHAGSEGQAPSYQAQQLPWDEQLLLKAVNILANISGSGRLCA